MKWLLKKLVIFLLTLLAISMLAFLAFQMIPGDPALSLLGTEATPERVEALREKMGLNDPIILQFGRWLLQFVRGDMGTSYSYQMSVSEMLKGKLMITLTLTGLSFVFILLLSIPIGIFGIKKGGLLNKCIGIVNQIIMAVPPFFGGEQGDEFLPSLAEFFSLIFLVLYFVFFVREVLYRMNKM